MINILKRFAGWVIASPQDKFRSATLKLTFFYVLSTAGILLVSSLMVLTIFAPAERLPIDGLENDVVEIEHSEWSLYEVREHLVAVIVLVDVSILFVVCALSYYFAQRTLLPIKTMHEEQQVFMSDVAHELRTPLAVILTGADTILRKPRLSGEYEMFITDVREEARRLTRMSNQLLKLLKTGTVEEVRLAEVNVSTLMEAEVQRFVSYAEGYGVRIVSNIPPNVTVVTDRDGVVEVLQNLLKNAVDYNKLGGTVTVSLAYVGDFVNLVITDTGIGMTADTCKTAFERFVKYDTARTQTTSSGAGLGLAIVKGLVTKMGGRIELESTLHQGTSVTISLPQTHS